MRASQAPSAPVSEVSEGALEQSRHRRLIGAAVLIGVVLLAIGGYQALQRQRDRPAPSISRTTIPEPLSRSRPAPDLVHPAPDVAHPAPDLRTPIVAAVGQFTPGGCYQICEDSSFCKQIVEFEADCRLELDANHPDFMALAQNCPQARLGLVAARHDGKKWQLECAP